MVKPHERGLVACAVLALGFILLMAGCSKPTASTISDQLTLQQSTWTAGKASYSIDPAGKVAFKKPWELGCAKDYSENCWDRMRDNNARLYIDAVCHNRGLGHAKYGVGHGDDMIDYIMCEKGRLDSTWKQGN